MSFDDIVSLFIAIIAMLFMVATSIKGARKSKREEELGYEDEEEEEEYEDQEQEQVQLPPPPPKPVSKPTQRPPQMQPVAVKKKLVQNTLYEFEPKMDSFSQKTAIDDRHLTIHLRPEDELVSDPFRDADGLTFVRQRKTKNIKQLIKSLPEDQLLFLSYEVFHVPVSKRPSPFPWNG